MIKTIMPDFIVGLLVIFFGTLAILLPFTVGFV
jgi:hypothetical protein